jgi:ParB-like chromosome segregation protein Spo0J
MAKNKGTPDDLLGQILGSVSGETRGGLHWIPLDRIIDNPYQARQEDDLDHIVGLAKSMAGLKTQLPATLGMQQPPTGRLVRVYGDDYEPFDPFVYKSERTIREALATDDVYVQLHFGHSRRQAFRVLASGIHVVFPDLNLPPTMDMGVDLDQAYSSMPLFLAHADKRTMFVHVATENAARKDLSAVEEAILLRRAIEEHGMSTEEAAKIFGWARSTASNKLRLLELPADVQKMVSKGTITERAARELVRLVDSPKYLQETVKTLTQGDGISTGRLVNDVNWRVEQAKKDAKLQAELETVAAVLANGWEPWPGAGVLTADRIGPYKNVPDWQHNTFKQNSDACKVCTGDCPCMRVMRQDYMRVMRQDYGDGVGKFQVSVAAPNVVLVCADQKRQDKLIEAYRETVKKDPQLAAAAAEVAKRVDVEAQRKEHERQDAIFEARRQGDEIWLGFIEHANRQEMWASLRFWKVAAARMPYGIAEALQKATTPAEAVNELLERMRNGCTEWDSSLREQVINPKKLQGLVDKLRSPKRKKEEKEEAPVADEPLPVL